MQSLIDEATELYDELDAIGDSLEFDGDERGASIKLKILRLRQILLEMGG